MEKRSALKIGNENSYEFDNIIWPSKLNENIDFRIISFLKVIWLKSYVSQWKRNLEYYKTDDTCKNHDFESKGILEIRLMVKHVF